MDDEQGPLTVRERSRPNRRGLATSVKQGIALNETMLHEVQMLMEPYQKGTVSSLRYPTSRIRFTTDAHGIRLRFPAMLALELYRSGILPQNASEDFSVSIDGKTVGNYRVTDFRYPGARAGHTDDILMVLTRVDSVSA